MTINPPTAITAEQIFDGAANLFAETKTHAPGPEGMLPITAEMLLTLPSGNLFGLSQSAGMGWAPARLLDPEFLILSTHGGMRAQDVKQPRRSLLIGVGRDCGWVWSTSTSFLARCNSHLGVSEIQLV